MFNNRKHQYTQVQACLIDNLQATIEHSDRENKSSQKKHTEKISELEYLLLKCSSESKTALEDQKRLNEVLKNRFFFCSLFEKRQIYLSLTK